VLAGIRKKLDLFGLAFVSFATSLGGGTVRDILIGNYPITWVADIRYPLAVLLAVGVTVIFQKHILRIRKVLLMCDMVGVAIFSILGLQKSLDFGISPGAAVIFGVMSAIMGGVIRDILCNEIPLVLRREIYASACLLGGLVFVLLLKTGLNMNINFAVSALLIIIVRLLALRYRFYLPRAYSETKKY
jgi:uncharacterized membrane protein YeiH